MPEITMIEAIRAALFEEMERDPAVVTLGEDIGVYGGAFKATEGLLARFGPERVMDTPISETAIVGAACGMSYLGLRPVVEMQFIDFIACCFNQVTNFAAKSHYRWGAPVPMVVRGPSGGGVHGGPFHSANPEMYFVHTPGLKVVYPSTPYDAKGLLKSAIRDNNPVLFFEHKFLYRRLKEELPSEDYTVPLGKAVVRREGKDLTILSYAAMMLPALDAAQQLSKEGIEAEVIDLRTLLPLDRDAILASVKNGVFAANFGGGQVDITSGKYVFQCTEAYKIENGKIGAPLKGAMLIGNGPTDLHRIRMIGNDLALDTGIGTCGKNGQGVPVGVGQPSLLMERITVGGTGA